MLEIFLIWRLTVYIGNQATRKGLKKGRYQIMAVFLWIIAEFTGGVIASAVFRGGSSFWFTYLIAFIAAVIGAGIAFLVMGFLPSQDSSEIGISSDIKNEPSGIQKFGRSGWIPLLVTLLAFSCLCLVIGGGVVLQTRSLIRQIRIVNPVVGTELDSNGQVIQDVSEISSNAEVIYLGFFLIIPQGGEIPVTVDWVNNGNIIYSGTESLKQGSHITKLELKLATLLEFPKGDYVVSMRIGNWLVNSVTFRIK